MSKLHTRLFRMPGLALAAGLAAMAFPAMAAKLPPPYVSRALDAVLIPVDASVRAAFGLKADQAGVLVLATSPGGVADAAGIEPGDVIDKAHGRAVTTPILLDEIVYYWIKQGKNDFAFDGWHGGKVQTYASTITLESYTLVIDVALVATWTAYSHDSFSYAEYTTEFSSEITESYSESETTIEETTTTAEFATEETTDEAAVDDAATDSAAPDDPAAGTDEPAAADDAPAADEPAADAPATDEPAADAPAADEPAADAPAADDSSSDAATGDETTGSDE
ncbi:MAG: PDZ domain-containing protein [Pseudorhodobacter sp.]|nr:PDZ domain-containing protein [Pseudorhodobacter sp.]